MPMVFVSPKCSSTNLIFLTHLMRWHPLFPLNPTLNILPTLPAKLPRLLPVNRPSLPGPRTLAIHICFKLLPIYMTILSRLPVQVCNNLSNNHNNLNYLPSPAILLRHRLITLNPNHGVT